MIHGSILTTDGRGARVESYIIDKLNQINLISLAPSMVKIDQWFKILGLKTAYDASFDSKIF